MNKIIRGKRYDTSTATECGSYSCDMPGDFDYICETLYRKSTGEFFLHGEGGARSAYAEPAEGGGWVGGEEIIPYTLEDAQKWAEKHLSGDKYEEIFGVVDEYSDKVSQMLRLSGSTVELLKRAASAKGKTMSDVADDILSNALNDICK